jgi:hypothetical protein
MPIDMNNWEPIPSAEDLAEEEQQKFSGVEEVEGTPYEKGKAALTGFAQGRTFGLLKPAAAGVGTGIAKLSGEERPLGDVYDEMLGHAGAVLEEIKTKAPEYYAGGEVAGMLTGGAGAKIASKVPGLAGKGVLKAGARGSLAGGMETLVGQQTGIIEDSPEATALGFGGGFIGGAVGEKLSRAFYPQALKRYAGKKNFERFGELPVKVREEIAKIPGGAQAIGTEFLNTAKNISPKGKSAMLFLKKTQQMANTLGKRYNKTVGMIDEIMTKQGKNSIPANDIRNGVLNARPIKALVTSNIKQVRRSGEKVLEIIDEALGSDPYITFKEAQKAKRSIDKLLPKKAFSEMTMDQQNLAVAKSVLINNINDAMEKTLAQAGGNFPELAGQLNTQATQIRRLRAAESIARNTTPGGGPGFNITPVDMAFAASTPTGAKFLTIKELTKLVSEPISNLTRGTRVYGALALSKGMDKLPEKFREPLANAARKGYKAFVIKDKNLMRNMEYRKWREQAAESGLRYLFPDEVE